MKKWTKVIIIVDDKDWYMFSSLDGSMFVFPVCYHPTTLLSIDDDVGMLKLLALNLENEISLLCFNTPETALDYTKHKHLYLPFTTRCMNKSEESICLMKIRQEIFNIDRLKEIVVFVTDYDMPKISGLELMKTMEFPPEISQYSNIILTGKASTDFKEKLTKMGKTVGFIQKNDPDYINKLIQQFKERTEKIFQWYSYPIARILSRDAREKTSFLFDGNFGSIFNAYINEKNICEFYLFDRQGSFIFLDRYANLSWLFVRNENGIQNSIELATQYGAPTQILKAIQSKKYILSLYEKEDFEIRTNIKWDDYLLPAIMFESDSKYLKFFSDLSHNSISKYYYAFTDNFPDHGITKEKILSYNNFLQEQE